MYKQEMFKTNLAIVKDMGMNWTENEENSGIHRLCYSDSSKMVQYPCSSTLLQTQQFPGLCFLLPIFFSDSALKILPFLPRWSSRGLWKEESLGMMVAVEFLDKVSNL